MKLKGKFSIGLILALFAGLSAFNEERERQKQTEKIEELENRILEIEGSH